MLIILKLARIFRGVRLPSSATAQLSARACPQTVADPALAESNPYTISEQTLAEASNPPCSCGDPKQCPDRVTDCISRAPESRPRITIWDLSARPHGLTFGVTDGARTRDLRSHNPPTDVAVCSSVGPYPHT